MKIAIYDRYWPTAGGGEKFAGGVAHVLAEDHDVTLLAHEPIDTDWLGERLALDLSKVAVEHIGEAHRVEGASAAHDLLINLSFKSSDRNGARRGIYVVHFPHDRRDRVPPRQQARLRRAEPVLRAAQRRGRPARSRALGPTRIRVGAGFYDLDVLRLSKVRWTDGDGDVLVTLPPGERTDLHLAFAPLLPPGHRLDATVEVDGRPAGRLTIGSVASKRDVIVPRSISVPVVGHADGTPVVVAVRSATWIPDEVLGNGDRRALGVPLVDVFLGRSPWAPARAALSLLQDYPPSLDFLDTYDTILANSMFTRAWIRRWWQRDSDVLYPPITLRTPADAGLPGGAKKPIVLSVGRFFAADRGHSKKQIEMVEAWRALLADPAARAVVEREGWSLHLVGGCDPADRPYVDQVRAAAAELPVEVHLDASGAELDRLYRAASIYWHAAGLDEDQTAHPERLEHFGITTVEAMSAGAVPVAFAAAGPLEAFRDGIEGFHFHTVDELVAATAGLLTDPARRAAMAERAVTRAEAFGLDAFAARVHAAVAKLMR